MFEKINPAANDSEKYPFIEMPETVNIDSANELIARLTEIIAEGNQLSSEDLEEATEMKMTLTELQNDLSDGEMKAPQELQIAILQLNAVLDKIE